jgi:hypothetical protein
MDISKQVEIVLRNAGFETWIWAEGTRSAICFEDASVIGFAHIFSSADTLLAEWKSAQQLLLLGHAPALRTSGAKAWNVYSVFLSLDIAKPSARLVERIEEDFTLTRKIARAGIQTVEDVQQALLPLTKLRSQPVIDPANFRERLYAGLAELPAEAVTAFLDNAPVGDVARLLGVRP